MKKIFFILFLIFLISCGSEETIPKPKGFLSLSYPVKSYKKLPLKRPYIFDVAENTIILDQKNRWVKIRYPKLKASIDITYLPVKNNIKMLLIEAEKLVYEHTIKADQIFGRDYVNPERKVYGKFAEITGNAASQIQFHVTDSTKHFLKGSLFFYTKPNYDSILPAVEYLKKDMIRIMESVEWR